MVLSTSGMRANNGRVQGEASTSIRVSGLRCLITLKSDCAMIMSPIQAGPTTNIFEGWDNDISRLGKATVQSNKTKATRKQNGSIFAPALPHLGEIIYSPLPTTHRDWTIHLLRL